jgi:hypothetical protein
MDVAHDAEKPGAQIAGPEEKVSAGEGPLQAILQQILATLIVRQQRAGVAAQSWDLGLEAALKFAH